MGWQDIVTFWRYGLAKRTEPGQMHQGLFTAFLPKGENPREEAKEREVGQLQLLGSSQA